MFDGTNKFLRDEFASIRRITCVAVDIYAVRRASPMRYSRHAILF